MAYGKRVVLPNTPNNQPEARQVGIFPLYYWLIEDGERKTVIRIDDSAGLTEVNHLARRAREEGAAIIEIEKASLNDWLETHSG